jgi:hypothetical protein
VVVVAKNGLGELKRRAKVRFLLAWRINFPKPILPQSFF